MTDAICNCVENAVENAERQVRKFSQRVQWTPLLLVISIFACENTHSVALGSDSKFSAYAYKRSNMRTYIVCAYWLLQRNIILYWFTSQSTT